MTDGQLAAPLSPAIAAKIAYERVSTIYRLTPLPQVGSVAFSLVIGYAMWGLVAPAWVIGWLVVRLGVSVWRATETGRFEGDPRRLQRIGYWRARFELLIVLDNLCWGVISVVFLPVTQSTMLGALLFAGVLCITAIGVFILISSFRTAVINFLAMLLPLMGSAVWNGYADGWIVWSSILIYGLVLTQESWRSNQRWMEMTRLRLELPMVADGSQPEFAEEMRQLFEATGASRLAEIERALDQGETDMLLRSLHVIKSSSAQVGAMELSGLASHFESLLREGVGAQSDWRPRLRAAWARLQRAWPAPEKLMQ